MRSKYHSEGMEEKMQPTESFAVSGMQNLGMGGRCLRFFCLRNFRVRGT